MDALPKNAGINPILFKPHAYPMDALRETPKMPASPDKIPAGLMLPLTNPASESRRPAPGALLPAVGRHHGFLRPLPLSHKK